ncbi:AraC family transcriptional regulator [Paenibacillus anaericanus]|nr:AraC family transcriptional regulator [Paenibacillus anaericanus]
MLKFRNISGLLQLLFGSRVKEAAMKAFHENRLYHSIIPFTAFIAHNFNFLAHWHNDLEFIYVCEGTIRIGINSESRILGKGDIAICSSGDIHYYDSKDNESSILIVIFNPQLIGVPGGWPKNIRLTSPFFSNSESESREHQGMFVEKMTDLMLNLLRESEDQSEHYEMFITGMVFELCGTILRYANSEPADLKKDKRRMITMKIMQEVLEYLEMNYSRAITLEDVARQANMSIFHFSRFFKSITGMSFISYLNNIRINKAEEMILNTNRSMIDIALDCGFTNVRTFNRVFRQLRQCTPSDLR